MSAHERSDSSTSTGSGSFETGSPPPPPPIIAPQQQQRPAPMHSFPPRSASSDSSADSLSPPPSAPSTPANAGSAVPSAPSSPPTRSAAGSQSSESGVGAGAFAAGGRPVHFRIFTAPPPPPPSSQPPPPPPPAVASPLAATRSVTPPPPIFTAQPSSSSSTPSRRSRNSSTTSEPESPPPPPAPPSPMMNTPRTPSVVGHSSPPDSPVEFVSDPTSPQQAGLTVTTGTAPQFQLLPAGSNNVVRVTGTTSMTASANEASDPAAASPASPSSVFQLKAAAPRATPPPLPVATKAPVAVTATTTPAAVPTSASFPPPPPPPQPTRSPPTPVGSGAYPAAPSRAAPPSPGSANGNGSGSFPPAPPKGAPTHSAQSSGEHPPPPPPPPPPAKPAAAAGSSVPSSATSPTTPPKPAATPASSPLSSFHLLTALQTIQTDSTSSSPSALLAGESELLETRSSMIDISRRNFILERELQDIDEKIKLLIKNRLTIQEVMASSTGAPAVSASGQDGALKNKRSYEELLFLLQSKPKYLACLSRLIQPRGDSIALFVQSVVFDIFGDSFGSYEERLLLSLFKQALQMEIEACTDRATLLRSNSAITQMLSAYAKRGQGLGILREILETPLKAICESRELRAINLELQPLKVHQQIIMDSETESGKRSHLDREVATDADAALVPEVQELLATRVKQLEECCDLILKPILDKVESIPYGMRWICKMIGEIYRAKFGTADDAAAASAGAEAVAAEEASEGDAAAVAAGPRSSPSPSTSASPAAAAAAAAASVGSAPLPAPRSSLASQIQSLQGGYIYLRFFNPVIVAPDAMNFIREKPSRTLRRNLVLIAKVLQNLSNGVLFGAKEIYMQPLNAYILQRMPAMKTFFAALTTVDDVDESLDLEKYTHSTLGGIAGSGGSRQKGMAAIHIQLNQIFALHAALLQFKEKLCVAARTQTYSAQDPLALILTKLGPTVPASVPRAENVSVMLRLVDTRATRMSLWNSEGEGAAAPTAAAAASAVSPTGGSAAAAVVHDPFQRGTAASSSTQDPLSNPLYMQAKNLLLSVLRRLPPEGAAEHTTLLSYLTAQKAASLAAGNHALCDAVNNVCSMLSTLFNMRLLSPGPLAPGASPAQAREQAYDLFLQACSTDAASRLRSRALLTKQRAMVDQALVTVSKHNAYLLGRLDVYRTYLVNVRQGQAQQLASSGSSGSGEQGSAKDRKKEKERAEKEAASAAAVSAKGGKKGSISEGGSSLGSGGDSSAKVDDFVKALKYTHAELVEMQLIASIDGDISPKILKSLVFEVRMVAPRSRRAIVTASGGAAGSSGGSSSRVHSTGVVAVLAPKFFLSVSLKKGVSIPLLATPFEIVLEDLLRLQEHATPTMAVEAVHLNVNILVHLLNTQFIAAIPKS